MTGRGRAERESIEAVRPARQTPCPRRHPRIRTTVLVGRRDCHLVPVQESRVGEAPARRREPHPEGDSRADLHHFRRICEREAQIEVLESGIFTALSAAPHLELERPDRRQDHLEEPVFRRVDEVLDLRPRVRLRHLRAVRAEELRRERLRADDDDVERQRAFVDGDRDRRRARAVRERAPEEPRVDVREHVRELLGLVRREAHAARAPRDVVEEIPRGAPRQAHSVEPRASERRHRLVDHPLLAERLRPGLRGARLGAERSLRIRIAPAVRQEHDERLIARLLLREIEQPLRLREPLREIGPGAVLSHGADRCLELRAIGGRADRDEPARGLAHAAVEPCHRDLVARAGQIHEELRRDLPQLPGIRRQHRRRRIDHEHRAQRPLGARRRREDHEDRERDEREERTARVGPWILDLRRTWSA